MTTINVMTVSGGKDSAAMWIYATRELGVKVHPVFSDTGNEHPTTYEYLDYLEQQLGPIQRIKADFASQIARKRDTVQTKWREESVPESIIEQALEVLHPTGNPFLDMAIWKGRFPSTKARFCTQELKIIPTMEQIYMPLLEAGHHVVSWQGVRAQESLARSKLPEREETPEGYEIYRPILRWTVEEVFAMHDKHGIDSNPLYKQGMGRVGCMPCINCGKQELYEIARRYPVEIERIAAWEGIVAKASKRGASTFFSTSSGHGEGIHDEVAWSRTAHGGKNYDLFKAMEFEDFPTCSSQYGLCE